MAKKLEGSGEGKAYEVGYGRPPVHSRFKPAQSGNPKGRTPGAKSTKAIIRKAFAKKVTLREGEKQRSLTKREALIEATINRGLQKGGKDADAAFKLMTIVEGDGDPSGVSPAALSRDEASVLASYESRLLRRLEDEAAARAKAHQSSDPTRADGDE